MSNRTTKNIKYLNKIITSQLSVTTITQKQVADLYEKECKGIDNVTQGQYFGNYCDITLQQAGVYMATNNIQCLWPRPYVCFNHCTIYQSEIYHDILI